MCIRDSPHRDADPNNAGDANNNSGHEHAHACAGDANEGPGHEHAYACACDADASQHPAGHG